MPRISPFVGLVFDPAVAGPPEVVTAPPYDVIGERERRAFLASSPWVTLLGICAVYLCSMPLSWLSYRRLAGTTPSAPPIAAPMAMDDADLDEQDDELPRR